VQAPRPRAGARDAGDGRRRIWVLAGAGAAVVAAAAVGVALLAFGGSSSARATIEQAGCTLDDRVPIRYAQVDGGEVVHVEEMPEGYEYPTFPPVGGTHHQVQSPLGIYEEPLEQLRLVHNQEHGAVVIQYGDDVAPADVNAIANWYREDPNGLMVAPLPGLNDEIALGAWTAEFDAAGTRVTSEWGVLGKCPRFDEDAFNAFVDEYGFRGPERARRDQLPPGGG